SAGNFLWVSQGASIPQCWDIAVDSASVYVAGDSLWKLDAATGTTLEVGQRGFQSWSVALDGAGNLFIADSRGIGDVHVTKFDSPGAFAWLQTGGGAQGASPDALAVGPDGAVYVAGRLGGTATFGSHTLTTTADREPFLARMSPDGS